MVPLLNPMRAMPPTACVKNTLDIKTYESNHGKNQPCAQTNRNHLIIIALMISSQVRICRCSQLVWVAEVSGSPALTHKCRRHLAQIRHNTRCDDQAVIRQKHCCLFSNSLHFTLSRMEETPHLDSTVPEGNEKKLSAK